MSRFGGFTSGAGRLLSNWNSSKASSAASVVAPTTEQEMDYSKTQGIWNLQSTVQFPNKLTPVVAADLFGSKGEISGNIVLPAIATDQMIVFMERENSLTPPALRAGFTNILTALIPLPAARSFRLQYRIGGGTETFTTTTAASYFVLNRAKSVGVSAVNQSTAAAITTPPIPALTGITSDGKSFVYATSYFPSAITAAGAPYTVITGVGAFVRNPVVPSLAASTVTTSATSYTLNCVVEFRP